MTVVEYLPSYAPRAIPRQVTCESLASVLELEWVAPWLHHPRFHRFSQDPAPPGWWLIVELDWGTVHYPLCATDEPLDPLPRFQPPTSS